MNVIAYESVSRKHQAASTSGGELGHHSYPVGKYRFLFQIE